MKRGREQLHGEVRKPYNPVRLGASAEGGGAGAAGGENTAGEEASCRASEAADEVGADNAEFSAESGLPVKQTGRAVTQIC